MFLRSEKVTLAPMDQSGWEALTEAHLDPAFDRLTADDLMPKTVQEIGALYSKFIYPRGRIFQVFTAEGTIQGIGFVGLSSIDLKNRNSEIHIAMWSKEHQTGGYGMEAGRLMLDYAFSNLGLHRVYALVIEGNDLLVNSAESIGFKVESVLKGCFFVDGKYKNGILIAAINPTR